MILPTPDPAPAALERRRIRKGIVAGGVGLIALALAGLGLLVTRDQGPGPAGPPGSSGPAGIPGQPGATIIVPGPTIIVPSAIPGPGSLGDPRPGTIPPASTTSTARPTPSSSSTTTTTSTSTTTTTTRPPIVTLTLPSVLDPPR